MPRPESSARASRDAAGAPGARANQKRRTRQALIDAALALRERGRDPSFAEVAEHARVSRATAYRYFPSVEALVSESAAERAMQPPERIRRAGEDPEAAIGRAARELNRVLVGDEVGLHVMERSFMAVWLDGAGGAQAPRPGRRLRYIRPIVDGLKEELPPAARRRLVQALAMVMGTEAVLALRDVAGASVDEALAASAWAAQALLRQARAEAARAKARRGAAGAAARREPPAAAPARRRGIT